MLFDEPLNYYKLNKPMSARQRLILIVMSCIIGIALGYGGYYLTSLYDDHIKAEILKNPVSVIGVVTQKRSYKGKGMTIEYMVNKEPYTCRTGVSTETYKKYKICDEIELLYNKSDPSQAMLKEELK